MAQMTLNRKQFTKLHDFCEKHGKEQFFLAKDEGAYVGATAGSQEDGNFERCLFYFKGCDPKKDADFHEEADHKFGYDDFGEFFSTDVLKQCVADEYVTKIVIKVTATGMSINAYARRPKQAA